MKNKNEVVGLVLNIFAVIALLLLIVVGLNFVGLYKLPAPVEKLLGTYSGSDDVSGTNNDKVHDLINKSVSKNKLSLVELSYENADKILKNLSVSRDYSQEIQLKNFFGNRILTEKVVVNRKNGLYDAVIYDSRNVPVKHISESENEIVIEIPGDDNSVTLPKGNFKFSNECGFVLDVDDFLSSDITLDDASFSQFTENNGSFISIVFDYDDSEFVLKQEFVISLDFGVVTEARSYEQNVLVYEMKTNSISDTF